MSQMDDDYEFMKANEQFQRKRRYERLPKSSAQLISRLISRKGFTQSQFNDELQTMWQKTAGKKFAGKTQATMIKRGVLEVIVDSSSAIQELAFEKSELLTRIQALLPDSNIKAIRFRVGRIRV